MFNSSKWQQKILGQNREFIILLKWNVQGWGFVSFLFRTVCADCSKWLQAAAAAKSLLSCPTLCDSIDGSPPGASVPGILQARIQEWVAISFSNAWKWKVKVKSLSRVWLLATPWTAAHQAPPSMGFSRQENWSGVPLPSPDSKLMQGQIWKRVCVCVRACVCVCVCVCLPNESEIKS